MPVTLLQAPCNSCPNDVYIVPVQLGGNQESAQGLGDGEGEHEVMAWQLAMQLSLEPLLGLAVLAAGAMAIAAGGGDERVKAAVLALVAD